MGTSHEHEWMLDASDRLRKQMRENPEPVLPADHPGYVPCRNCGAQVRADRIGCVLCGGELS